MLSKALIGKVFSAFSNSNPEPKTELHFENGFQLLIAVILSAQATDISVNKVTPELFKKAPTPEAMANLGEEGIRPLIKTIGLFNSKAKNIEKCCKQLLEKHAGKIPQTRAELESLAGVGKKTAGVVLNVLYGAKTLPVDTHVFRVSNRLGLVKTKTPESTEDKLIKVIPAKYLVYAHHWLILHGRYICKARTPLCDKCQVSQWCESCPQLSKEGNPPPKARSANKR